MKKHSFIVLISIVALSLSCSRMESEMEPRGGFPLEEAKSCFEALVSGAATRSGGVQPVRSRLSSGEITPWWEDAECVEGTGKITYTVPYEGEYRIYSYSGKYSEKPARPWRRVGQELVLSKDLGSGSVEVLVKSTAKRRGLRQKAKFSGVVVFTDLVSGGVRAVRLYENDTLKESVEIDMSGGKEAMIESCRRAVKMLKGYQFFRNRNIRTRSDDGEGDPDGDDGDEWEYPPIDELEDLGDGLYEDPDTGALYYDSDGDGEIDSMLIEPSVVTGGGGGGGSGPDDPDPDDPDPEDPEDPEFPDDPGPSGPTDEELEAVGLVAVNKMAADVSNGNVITRQLVGATLTAVNVSLNSHGIIFSAAQALQSAASDALTLRRIGGGLSIASTAVGLCQTLIAVSDDDPTLTTGEWLNAISAVFGAVSAATSFIPFVSVSSGVLSGVIGLVSVFFSENVLPGEYTVELDSGKIITITIYCS